ncbi:hypothetical protein CIHG_01647 [Coccidioides immitis H538.4]|uniref:Uncharacterized protein n=3 Tax=Coccidioides immitis TaxID=5501 RepID=A0A0J8R9C1_COCIT|nr:hypothetical protein CIRG_01498 [Coccidioides immitis RMSCC 2394]KMU81486.1 hypothetical protein CISG_09156 [Coccidioides immitis RMSCC 3703]KMU83863.1 hypothetical protein CIHG_01647 [Coccidioides immitis H538.4]
MYQQKGMSVSRSHYSARPLVRAGIDATAFREVTELFFVLIWMCSLQLRDHEPYTHLQPWLVARQYGITSVTPGPCRSRLGPSNSSSPLLVIGDHWLISL